METHLQLIGGGPAEGDARRVFSMELGAGGDELQEDELMDDDEEEGEEDWVRTMEDRIGYQGARSATNIVFDDHEAEWIHRCMVHDLIANFTVTISQVKSPNSKTHAYTKRHVTTFK
jgi:hypothetical protein